MSHVVEKDSWLSGGDWWVEVGSDQVKKRWEEGREASLMINEVTEVVTIQILKLKEDSISLD